ncbi:EAL domain-containing protein [Erythrobacter donghaensis]|uniref:EAL domain-containing protein n=1 Tax=Erythrobacter donghaensis TaxID=267135 RepID=UPI000A368671|nr:EAL domain-containing protein [Erythrobacter donghaensis]
MIASLNNIATKARSVFGFEREEAAVLKPQIELGSGGGLLRRKRIKVAILALLFGVVSAAIELPLPAEDMYRAVRAHLRLRPMPQDIAVVKIDDKTLRAFGGQDPGRVSDSRVVDILIASGVRKVIFDRAHADRESPEADAVFADMLRRQKGKVWLGVSPDFEIGIQQVTDLKPLDQFQQEAALAAMNGLGSPFALSVSFPTYVKVDSKTHRSISATLADYTGPETTFRPDYAFNIETLPTFRYVDVLNGDVPDEALRGKSVIISYTYEKSNDFFRLPLQNGYVPGSYFHVMGAHTLKRGVPVDLLWLPAMALAVLAIAAQAFTGSRSRRILALVALGLMAAPLVLDEFNINVDIMPALLALLAAGIGFQRINRKYFSSDVDAMTTTALSSDKPDEERDVYALKIANLSEISEDWSAREVGEFVNTLISYVKGPSEVGDVAFERDILVWLAPRMDTTELDRHADGLALMLKTAISYEWQSSTSTPSLGIDTNHDLPVALRIKKAMQAADEAAGRGLRFIINDAAHLEARNNRLELIRVLEQGLRERSISVAYQPKIDLASGRIVGAETLIRWQPDGREYVNPLDLVLAAEAGDRINELTLVVMEAALIEGKQAIALDPRFKLAVNMSAKSLSDTHLLFDIMTLLGRFDFPPENLTLELTETAKLDDDRIAPQIAALKARGICLSIDDFGTGESNLEYIEKLPSSELKIDRRFVQHMATSDESRAVVRATIEIAHSLGKVVVAEGVEDHATAAALRAMGCDQAQGYLFSRAIVMPELLAMMGGGRNAIYG